MILALDVPSIDSALVVGVLDALADYNARTYELDRSRKLPAPWSIAYRPDPFGRRVQLRDVERLLVRGHGSCGELAAAYAGWLRAHGTDARIEAIDDGPDSWHAIAVVDDGRGRWTYDPATIAARGGGVQWPAVIATGR